MKKIWKTENQWRRKKREENYMKKGSNIKKKHIMANNIQAEKNENW